MKTKNIRCQSALLFLGLCSILQACTKPSDGVDVTVNTNLSNTHVLVRFADAKSDAAALGDFNVTIGGAGTALVVDNYGGKTFKAHNGFLELALVKSAKPTAQNPVSFTVAAGIAGYAPAVQTVSVTSDSSIVQTIAVVSYTNAVAGTAAQQQTATLTNGTPATAVTVNTTTNTTIAEVAKITIPAGVKFYDAAASQVTAAQLTTKMVFYGTGSEAALRALPGGLTPADVTGPNGPIAGGVTFITAGMVQIDMEAGGKEIKSFSQPIAVTSELKADLVNPVTHLPVAVGDVIPLWSLNATTNQWKYEGTTTVSLSGSGKKQVQYAPTHLSAWAASWYYVASDNPLTITVSMPANQAGTYWLELINSNGSFLSGVDASNSWSKGIYLYDGLTITVAHPANVADVKLVLYRNNGADKLTETELFNAATKGSITLVIPASASVPALSTVNMTLEAHCTNKGIIAKISSNVMIYKLVGTDYQYYKAVYVTDGLTSFTLENNQKYRVETYYGSKKYSALIDYKSATFSFSNATTNASLTGMAVYDANTNTYTTTANIAVSCN